MVENNINKLEKIVKSKMHEYEEVRGRLGTIRAL
jgi:hypothetical protein